MHRFFVGREQLNTDNPVISGTDYNHIHNVLRMRSGEEILLSDGENDTEYLCAITGYDTEMEQVLLQVVDIFGNTRELPARITLFQGYPKGDKFDMIIQKAVELGVFEIVPVMMKRCVVKLDENKASKKVERLNAVSLSAAKQSKRGIVPKVRPVMDMKQALQYARQMDYIILPYERASDMEYSKKVMAEAKNKKSIAVFIGPEGGFEPSEAEAVEEAGGKSISLGHRILRTETAGMTVLSLLMYLLEE